MSGMVDEILTAPGRCDWHHVSKSRRRPFWFCRWCKGFSKTNECLVNKALTPKEAGHDDG